VNPTLKAVLIHVFGISVSVTTEAFWSQAPPTVKETHQPRWYAAGDICQLKVHGTERGMGNIGQVMRTSFSSKWKVMTRLLPVSQQVLKEALMNGSGGNEKRTKDNCIQLSSR
jgi:hypothetical protein